MYRATNLLRKTKINTSLCFTVSVFSFSVAVYVLIVLGLLRNPVSLTELRLKIAGHILKTRGFL